MKTKNIPIKELIKLLSPRTMVKQKPKIQPNKRLYERDINGRWKNDEE